MLAFYELAVIAYNNKKRRISIFLDIERKTTIWTEIKVECLGVLNDVLVPLQKLQKKSKKPTDVKVAPSKKEGKPTPSASVIPIRDADIFIHKTQSANIMDGLQDKNAKASKEVIGFYEQLKSETYLKFRQYSTKLEFIFDSDFTKFLHFTIERRANILIPNPTLTSTAVAALSMLVLKSMEEDEYGTVQKDIPEILHKLTEAIVALRAFVENPTAHWSNKRELASKEPQRLEGMRSVLAETEASFDRIIEGFYQYLGTLKLSQEVIDMINERISTWPMSELEIELYEIKIKM